MVRMRFGITARRDRADAVEARRAATIAVERLAGADRLVGDMLTLADITLAAMSASCSCSNGTSGFWGATSSRPA
jgi:glutathione S-transferase